MTFRDIKFDVLLKIDNTIFTKEMVLTPYRQASKVKILLIDQKGSENSLNTLKILKNRF